MNLNMPFYIVRQVSSRSKLVILFGLESLKLTTPAILVIAMAIVTHELKAASTSPANKL